MNLNKTKLLAIFISLLYLEKYGNPLGSFKVLVHFLSMSVYLLTAYQMMTRLLCITDFI